MGVYIICLHANRNLHSDYHNLCIVTNPDLEVRLKKKEKKEKEKEKKRKKKGGGGGE